MKAIKPDCCNCLNHNGYGWDCDRDPREFEPEYKLVDVPGEKNTVTSDFSNIPKDRKIYCREFIPEGDKKTTPHWSQCNYVNNKWYKRSK